MRLPDLPGGLAELAYTRPPGSYGGSVVMIEVSLADTVD